MNIKLIRLGIVVSYFIVSPHHSFAGLEESGNVAGSPSDLFASDDQVKHGAAMVVMLQREDLRQNYCTGEVLARRKTDRLILLDNIGKSREVAIGDAKDVESILKACGMANLWRTSWQPQARLITKDAIYQSPASFDTTLKTAFLRRAIEPGDMLVVTLAD
jgi:hypothetical protein